MGKQKNVVLILARELASNIATPMLVIDEVGTIVFFNEPAEKVLGASFASVGEVSAEEYDGEWATTDPDGNEISLLTGPLSRVVSDHTPAHRVIRVRGLDGVWHVIETTVYPLFAQRLAASSAPWACSGSSAVRSARRRASRRSRPSNEGPGVGHARFAGVTGTAHGALRRQHVVCRRHAAGRHAARPRRRLGHP